MARSELLAANSRLQETSQALLLKGKQLADSSQNLKDCKAALAQVRIEYDVLQAEHVDCVPRMELTDAVARGMLVCVCT